MHYPGWGILMACTLPPWMSWSKVPVISLRTGPSLTFAALLSPGMIPFSRLRAWELSMGQSSMVTPDISLINSLDTVCVEAFPLLFLLLLVILVTFLSHLAHPEVLWAWKVRCSIFAIRHCSLWKWRYPQWIKTLSLQLCQCYSFPIYPGKHRRPGKYV